MRGGMRVLLAVLAAIGPAAAPAAPAGSRQAAYDAAQAAYDRSDWAGAVAGFAPLVPADPNRALSASQGVIAVRLADALARTGDAAGAVAMAKRGIAAVPAGDAATLADGWLVIADRAAAALDPVAAADAYDRVLRYATASGYDTQRIAAVAGMGGMLATIDPARAAPPVDALLADRALVTKLSKPAMAAIEEVRARIALNAGDLVTAQRWIDRAITASGGLGLTVDQLQLAIRGDAAIVAQLRKDPDEARKYLTYTGAGHLDSVDWITSFSGDLPVCGTDGDLRPDDSAVVQLAIDADGKVVSALPIYASRAGDVGGAFARAARGWRWLPSALTKVSPFWRASLRLEMRCDTRPDPVALGKPVLIAAYDWLRTHGVPVSDHPQFLVSSEPGNGNGAPIPIRLALDETYLASTPHPFDHLVIPKDRPAPVVAVEIFEIALGSARRARTVREAARARAAELARLVPAFAARYPDTPALAWLRTEWATALEASGDFATALPLLGQVLATPETVLGRDDPIRQVATLHVAVVRTRMGDAAGAQADLKAAGVNAAQCSLVDTRPIATNLRMVSSQFPLDALRWRFEGFARVAYDIGADGHVTDIRTVLAYPPFVFGPGTEAAARSFRYAAPTIDGKPVGCQGESQIVRYRIPG